MKYDFLNVVTKIDELIGKDLKKDSAYQRMVEHHEMELCTIFLEMNILKSAV